MNHSNRPKDVEIEHQGASYPLKLASKGQTRYDDLLGFVLKSLKEVAVQTHFNESGEIGISDLSCLYPAWAGFLGKVVFKNAKPKLCEIYSETAGPSPDGVRKLLATIFAHSPRKIFPGELNWQELIHEANSVQGANGRPKVIISDGNNSSELFVPLPGTGIWNLLRDRTHLLPKCVIASDLNLSGNFSVLEFTWGSKGKYVIDTKEIQRARVTFEGGKATQVVYLGKDQAGQEMEVVERDLETQVFSSKLSIAEIVERLKRAKDYNQRRVSICVSLEGQDFQLCIPEVSSGSNIYDQLFSEELRLANQATIERTLPASGMSSTFGVNRGFNKKHGNRKVVLDLEKGRVVQYNFLD